MNKNEVFKRYINSLHNFHEAYFKTFQYVNGASSVIEIDTAGFTSNEVALMDKDFTLINKKQ